MTEATAAHDSACPISAAAGPLWSIGHPIGSEKRRRHRVGPQRPHAGRPSNSLWLSQFPRKNLPAFVQPAAAGDVMSVHTPHRGIHAQQGENPMSKRAALVLPVAGLGLLALAACSPPAPNAAPSTSTPAPVLTTTASSAPAPTTASTPKATQAADTASPGCKVNPANHPVPTADPYEWVPAADQVRVSLSGIPSGEVKVTGTPVEVDLTVCNDSPVAYPQVGFVLALDHCGCANNPLHIADGTVQVYYHDQWITVPNAHAGGGMDYLSTFTSQQALPKGKAVTVRYRIAYDPSMASGQGGVVGAVVTPDGPHVLGGANLSYTVNH